jgi:hypothetical protein
MDVSAKCRLEEITFHGWTGVLLTNGLVSVMAVPELGGRLMSFELGPYQYLFMNRELMGKRFTPEEHTGDGSLLAWKNYGGDKTWPAPQGWERGDQWPGPPDAVLDSGRYEFEPFKDAGRCGLTMVSPADKRTGLQIHRTVTLSPQCARLGFELTFENVIDHPIRWAIWDVAQLACPRPPPRDAAGIDTDCWLYIPTGTASGSPYQVMFGNENPQWNVTPGMLAVQYLGYIGKIGVASPAGWIAFANRSAGYVLCIRFPYEAGAAYPDGGASVECWTESPGATPPIPFKSAGYLLEAEVLSPLRTLHPGNKTSFPVEWAAAYCPGPVSGVNDAGCIHQPLQVIPDGKWAQVRGVFGCFEVGQAALACLDERGKVLRQVVLQQASPLSVLRVDSVLALPDGAARFRLGLIRSDGTFAGMIDEAAV